MTTPADRRERPPLWPVPMSLRFAIGGAVIAFVMGGLALSDHDLRNTAVDLRDHGHWVTATDVSVLVVKDTGRYGSSWNVEDVTARLPGSDAPVHLELRVGPGELPENSPTGWQPPTAATGYATPLRVRVLSDGDGTVRHAAADTDLDYWLRDNYDPEIDATLAGLPLLVTAAGAVRFARLWRRPGRHFRPAPHLSWLARPQRARTVSPIRNTSHRRKGSP